MPTPVRIPFALVDRAFTIAEAEAVGVSRRVLQGKRFDQVVPGVYRCAASPLTFEMGVAAAVRAMPRGAAISHVSNLRWRGLEMRGEWPIHVAVKSWSRQDIEKIFVHRYQRRPEVEVVRGVLLVTPERTFIDCGTMLSTSELVSVGDWMVQQRLTTPERLLDHAIRAHFDGVQRARKAAEQVRVGAESPPESALRFALVSAGLPEPEVNTDIVDGRGTFLARGDLVYRREKLLVEYDGWYHERSAEQRRKDILRRERLEAAGWRVIVVTAIDMRRPEEVVERVRRALG